MPPGGERIDRTAERVTMETSDQPSITSDSLGIDGGPARESLDPDQPVHSNSDENAIPEEDLWVGRTHWKHYAGRLLLWAVAQTGLAILLWFAATRSETLSAKAGFLIWALVFLGSGLEVIGRRTFLEIIGHRYRLTTQRLFIERGILSQTIDQTELIRVDDVRLHRTLADRLFGLGSVAIVSTDATDHDVLITGIAEPDRVAEAIRGRMRSMRRKSLFIENL